MEWKKTVYKDTPTQSRDAEFSQGPFDGLTDMNTSIRILRLPAVKQLTGLSRSEIYRRISLNEFPQRISLGARAVGWVESEINSYLESCIKQSRSGIPDSRKAA